MLTSDECWHHVKRCLHRANQSDMPKMKVYWAKMVERWTQYAEEAERRERQRERGETVNSHRLPEEP
jgi:hypothetical protein